MHLFPRQVLALTLTVLLPASAWSQQEWLKIAVLEGENASHNVRRKAVSPTSVEVRDERGQLVSGAQLEFTLPNLGPGGRFSDGARTTIVFTDPQGRASLAGFVPNDIEGRFTILVKAKSGAREGSTSITQNNSIFQSTPLSAAPRQSTGSGRKLTLLLVAGAAAATAGILAVRGGRESGSAGTIPSVPTGIAIGSITIGGPR